MPERNREEDEIVPDHEPDLQIVPVSDTEKGETTENERQVIYDVLNTPDVRLPWVTPSKRERGRA